MAKEEDFDKGFAARFVEVTKGYTQQEIADATETSSSNITMFKRGHVPSAKFFIALKAKLIPNLDINYLLTGQNSQNGNIDSQKRENPDEILMQDGKIVMSLEKYVSMERHAAEVETELRDCRGILSEHIQKIESAIEKKAAPHGIHEARVFKHRESLS